jgi:hypothetical protein
MKNGECENNKKCLSTFNHNDERESPRIEKGGSIPSATVGWAEGRANNRRVWQLQSLTPVSLKKERRLQHHHHHQHHLQFFSFLIYVRISTSK